MLGNIIVYLCIAYLEAGTIKSMFCLPQLQIRTISCPYFMISNYFNIHPNNVSLNNVMKINQPKDIYHLANKGSPGRTDTKEHTVPRSRVLSDAVIQPNFLPHFCSAKPDSDY